MPPQLNGWKDRVLKIAGAILVASILAAFGFSIQVSREVAAAAEKMNGHGQTLANTRQRAIESEQKIERLDAEYREFRAWYMEDRRQNIEAHREILAAIKDLKP